MQPNKKLQSFIIGVALTALSTTLWSSSYAKGEESPAALKNRIKKIMSSSHRIEKKTASETLTKETASDNMTFYCPETGEEKTIEVSSSLEDAQPLLPTDPDEDNEPKEDDNELPPGVINTYDRRSNFKKVKDARIMLLEIEVEGKNNKKEYSYCSGAIVSRYTIVTAAHCLRALKKNGTIKAYAGGKNARYTSYKSKTWYPKRVLQPIPVVNLQIDYGYIILKDPLGDKVGTFGGTNATLKIGNEISVYGFPHSLSKDRPIVSKGNRIPIPLSAGNPVIELLSDLFDFYGAFTHSAYSEKGMSGGPVFNTWGDPELLIGVHSSHWVPLGLNEKYQLFTIGSGLGKMKNLVIERRKEERAKPAAKGKSSRHK